MKIRLFSFLVLALFALFVLSNSFAQTSGTSYAWLRFAHLSADAPDVDVYVDDQLVLDHVSYKTVSEYLPITQDGHTITFVPTGEAQDQAVITPVTLPFVAGETYLLGIAGLVADNNLQLAAIQESGTIRAVQENNPNMAEQDSLAGFILLHGLSGGPEIALITQTGEVVTTDVGFTNLYISPVRPGRYPLLITTSEGESIVLFNELNPFTLSGGVTYFVAVVGTRVNPELVVVASGTQTLQTLISESVDVSGFRRLAEIAGQFETLAEVRQHTLFIPSNDALADSPIDLNAMLNDPEALKGLLDYHVVEGEIALEELMSLETLTTISGETITVSVSEDGESVILNNDITVNTVGIQALNGRIYLIDRVLQPESFE